MLSKFWSFILTPACSYFYFPYSQCFLFKSCDEIEDCDNCISGRFHYATLCSFQFFSSSSQQPQTYRKVMILRILIHLIRFISSVRFYPVSSHYIQSHFFICNLNLSLILSHHICFVYHPMLIHAKKLWNDNMNFKLNYLLAEKRE